jgi:hypothetical protein
MSTPDLTQRPPRSPRTRLGGYAILPRMLDKGRATIAGKHGEYKYACPLDQQFLNFAGIDAAKIKKQLALGKGDGDMLIWIQKNAKFERSPVEIAAWTDSQERRGPTDVDSRKFLQDLHAKVAPHRTDVATWFDLLDIDDYASFGGKA